MNIEDRVDKVERRVDRVEKRDGLIEQAILQIRDLIVRHDDRLENFHIELRESREDFNFKLNALIEAQMENEAGIRELRKSTYRTPEIDYRTSEIIFRTPAGFTVATDAN